jgi:hypothetical protein
MLLEDYLPSRGGDVEERGLEKVNPYSLPFSSKRRR